VADVTMSEWMFKANPPLPGRGEYMGVGASGQQPLFTRIMVRSPSSSGESMRVRFEPGATTAAVQGQLNGVPARDYVLRAIKGQTMIVTLSGPGPHTRVQVLQPGRRNPLLGQAANTFYWRGVLPVTGDYVIRISSNDANERFGFIVQVPQRISFARGAVSAQVRGSTAARRTVTYLLWALANQRMTVDLIAPRGAAGLTIYGLSDGQPLARAESGATSWSGRLPATQDYVIDVVPAVDAGLDFDVQVTVR
jgi:hypothetical protein